MMLIANLDVRLVVLLPLFKVYMPMEVFAGMRLACQRQDVHAFQEAGLAMIALN